MMPSPTELTYFLEIAATQNISRASERLGITQPSLSLAIKRLEAQVGVELLLRSKTGVTLTRAGQRFSVKARVLLEQWQAVLQAIKREESEIAGSYRVGAHVSVACGYVAKALPSLLSEHPHLELTMHHDLSRRITEKVINFELDFGVVVNPVDHPDLVIRKLYEDEVTFYQAPQAQLDPNNLLLCYDSDLLQGRWLLKIAKEAGITFRRSFTSSSLELIAQVVSSQPAVAILPGLVALSAPRPLEIASFGVAPFIDSHALIYRADSQSSFASKQLARALEQAIRTTANAKKADIAIHGFQKHDMDGA